MRLTEEEGGFNPVGYWLQRGRDRMIDTPKFTRVSSLLFTAVGLLVAFNRRVFAKSKCSDLTDHPRSVGSNSLESLGDLQSIWHPTRSYRVLKSLETHQTSI